MNRPGPDHRRIGVRRLVGMEVVSGLGDGVFWVGLAAVLLDGHADAAGFALAAFARLGPRALVSAPAGVLADRVDRRRLLVTLDLARALLMLALAAAAAAGVELSILLAIVFVSYTAAAPYRPALTAALPQVAGESGLATANALLSTVRQLMTFLGPLAGAVVLRYWSPEAAFAIDALSFAAAALLVGSVRALSGRRSATTVTLAAQRASFRREIVEGWREMQRVSGLTVVAVLIFAMYVARGAEMLLFVLLADGRLDLDASGSGILLGAVGLGALAVLPLARRISRTKRPALAMTLGLATTAVPFMALSAITSTPVAFVTLVVLGAGVVVFELISVMLLQRLGRRHGLGRVFGLIGAISNTGKLIGALTAPLAATAFSVEKAMLISGLAVGVLGVASARGLMRLERTTRERHRQLRPISDALGTLRLFEAAPEAVLEWLASEVVAQKVPAGTAVVLKGDAADDMYVVREGHFLVFDDDRQINEVNAGEWFGEIGLIHGSPRTATVVADTDALVWRIPGDTFLDSLQEGASEPTSMLEVMSDRLARTASLRHGEQPLGDQQVS